MLFAVSICRAKSSCYQIGVCCEYAMKMPYLCPVIAHVQTYTDLSMTYYPFNIQWPKETLTVIFPHTRSLQIAF